MGATDDSSEFFLRSNKFRIVGVIASIILFFLVAFNFKEQKWRNWTGFGEDSIQIETTEKDGNGNIIKTTLAKQQEPSKTLWNVLELFGILAIPIILAYLGYQVQKKEQKFNEENLLEEILQKYLDDISGLLLENNLGDDNNDNSARDIGTFKTLTVLRRLNKDYDRKLIILLFLYDANLINPIQKINLENCDFSGISIYGADLKETDFTGANLARVNFTKADLECAKFHKADLSGIDFSGAILKGANFNGAKLRKAILSRADLEGADFTGANVLEADFTKARNIILEEIRRANNWEKAKYDSEL